MRASLADVLGLLGAVCLTAGAVLALGVAAGLLTFGAQCVVVSYLLGRSEAAQ